MIWKPFLKQARGLGIGWNLPGDHLIRIIDSTILPFAASKSRCKALHGNSEALAGSSVGSSLSSIRLEPAYQVQRGLNVGLTGTIRVHSRRK